jgi:hypothetical protein
MKNVFRVNQNFHAAHGLDVQVIRLQVVTRVLRRMSVRATALAWDAWLQHAAAQRRLTGAAMNSVRRMLNRTVALALGRWKEQAVELRAQRQVTVLVKSRLDIMNRPSHREGIPA